MEPLDKNGVFFCSKKEAKMKEKNKEKAELVWAKTKHVFVLYIYRDVCIHVSTIFMPKKRKYSYTEIYSICLAVIQSFQRGRPLVD